MTKNRRWRSSHAFQEALGAISARNARKAPTRALSGRVHQPRRAFAPSA